MNIRVEIKGCDADTELELVCTDKQYAFLRELAKATKSVFFMAVCQLLTYMRMILR